MPVFSRFARGGAARHQQSVAIKERLRGASVTEVLRLVLTVSAPYSPTTDCTGLRLDSIIA